MSPGLTPLTQPQEIERRTGPSGIERARSDKALQVRLSIQHFSVSIFQVQVGIIRKRKYVTSLYKGVDQGVQASEMACKRRAATPNLILEARIHFFHVANRNPNFGAFVAKWTLPSCSTADLPENVHTSCRELSRFASGLLARLREHAAQAQQTTSFRSQHGCISLTSCTGHGPS